jgi:hypothetical protein
MKSILRALVIFSTVFVTYTSAGFSTKLYAADIDKAMVEKLSAAADQAIEKKDIDALGKLISPNAKITITANADGQRQTMTMSKAEYLASAREQMRITTNYKYSRKMISVEIVGQGKKAIAKDKTTETMRISGQMIRGVTTSTAAIELFGGTPMFTSIVGDATIEMQ